MTDAIQYVKIEPDTLIELIRHAYIAGCYAVHENYQPQPDPEFGEAADDYAIGLDLTSDTKPLRLTPAMLKAGAQEFAMCAQRVQTAEDCARDIYNAMVDAG